MQIPILNGIYTSEQADFRQSYPVNLVPMPLDQGISHGYLRPADGVVELKDTGLNGVCRGGINWNGVCYRVIGTKLVSLDKLGQATVIGDVGGSENVTFDYSFTYLAVASGQKLFLYDGTTLKQVTDSDLGVVLDLIWVDGYFMTTDGASLVVTELNDPFSVLPTKYGSSEADPDPIVAVLKLNNEPQAINRYTIEVFNDVGGTGFPFERISGALIQKGAVGTHACCLFMDAIAFIGGGRNESIAVWLGASGQTTKLSTREIDLLLAKYPEATLAQALCEAKTDKGHQELLIHLPDKTLVFDGAATNTIGQPIWYVLSSGAVGVDQYRARHLVRCYNQWLIGDAQSAKVGYLSSDTGYHWGQPVHWEFGTILIYNEGNGAIFHELELVALPGRALLGDDPTVWTSYSTDGETWSTERGVSAGRQGQRNKRLVWLGQGSMRLWRAQRFRGTSDARLSLARLDARLEPLGA